jgi:hypothetical protein
MEPLRAIIYRLVEPRQQTPAAVSAAAMSRRRTQPATAITIP